MPGTGTGAVDGEVDGLAVDVAWRRGLVGVELDDPVEGVRVADHGEDGGIALVGGDAVDVGEVEGEGASGGVVEDDELAGSLFGGVDGGSTGWDGERRGESGEGSG